VLHSFATGGDGELPYSGLVIDSERNLYGTTNVGGSNCGIVFEITPAGTETVLHDFGGAVHGDGCMPFSGLVLAGKPHSLYGTTFGGGTSNRGAVIELGI